jgi:hypothetical protein
MKQQTNQPNQAHTKPNQTKPNQTTSKSTSNYPSPQVGLTDATQYEHRVGRTGRAGKTGLALLLLSDDESRLLGQLSGFPIAPAGPQSEITGGVVGGRAGLPVAPQLARAFQAVGRDGELKSSADKAFVATLGFLAGEEQTGGSSFFPILHRLRASRKAALN